MCWRTYKKPYYRIAKKDILVYKILIKKTDLENLPFNRENSKKTRFYSEYQHFEYVPGKKNFPIQIKARRAWGSISKYEIYSGYHSWNKVSNIQLNDIYNGYCYNDNRRFYKFVIPKGTKYAINFVNGVDGRNLVSENIKMVSDKFIPIHSLRKLARE